MGNDVTKAINDAGKTLDKAVKQGEEELSRVSAPTNPILCFQTGKQISLQSCTSLKYLRCLPNGELDAVGIFDRTSNFAINLIADNTFTIGSMAYSGKYINIQDGIVSCNGTGTIDCYFRVTLTADKNVILESVANPGYHIGALQNGSITSPSQTMKEHLASHFKVFQTNSVNTVFSQTASDIQKGVNEVVTSGNPIEALQTGNIVLLESKLSKRCIQIKEDGRVDGLGLAESTGKLYVHVLSSSTADIVCSFYSTLQKRYIALSDGMITSKSTTNADTDTHFRISVAPGNYVTLESAASPGSYVGVLANGSITEPSKTALGSDVSHFKILHQKIHL